MIMTLTLKSFSSISYLNKGFKNQEPCGKRGGVLCVSVETITTDD